MIKVFLIAEGIYTAESDVWSFGVLLFEIFTIGSVPYGSANKQPEVRRFIADGMNPMDFQAPRCSEKIFGIMSKIFVTQREDRPNFGELLAAFESLLGSRGVRIPRPDRRRDVSPFRQAVHHQHQRVQELGTTGSNDQLSSSPPSNTSLSGGTPPNGSFPDVNNPSSRSHFHNNHASQHAHHPQTGNLLGVSPPNSYSERRYSETPPREARRRDLLVVDTGVGGRSNSPRRTASFNNISKPEAIQKVEQRKINPQDQLLRDYVPNRFGGNSNKKQFNEFSQE